MATKTIAEKLAIKPGMRVWLSDLDHADTVSALPAGAQYVVEIAEADVAIQFARSATSLRSSLDMNQNSIAKPPVVWIVYPKGNKADINRDSIWPVLVEYGLRPNGQVAVDDVWSALRFRALRPDEIPFHGVGAS